MTSFEIQQTRVHRDTPHNQPESQYHMICENLPRYVIICPHIPTLVISLPECTSSKVLQHAEQDQFPCGSTGTCSGNLKLAWFGLVTRHDDLSKGTLLGTLEGLGCHGRQRKCWMDIIKEWSSLPQNCLARTAHKGLLQKRLEEDLCWIFPHVPLTTQSVKGLN